MINSHGLIATFHSKYKFSVDGNVTDIFIKGVQTKANCGNDGFKYGTISTSTWIPTSGATMVDLCDINSDHLTSNLDLIWYQDEPHMPDGRPIFRPDSRPRDTETNFTMVGDEGDVIGGGKEIRWDFSNDDDLYTGSEIPSGYKAKEIKVKFMCPIHTKDGCVYFFDAPWGSYIQMHIMVPDGQYYPNPAGSIPASMLGLPGNKMYAQAVGDTVFQVYVTKHFMHQSCPMGDELNAEGSAENPLPIGWYIRGLIVTPEDDNVSKGYAEIEVHRCHTVLLPGQTNPHK